ncbi:MAG TPA: glucose 1-dehydrogenase [Stellaceae bacterium]|nr:glucose 1-dehydrogenase [Stellaceae bacterium]
MSVVLVTGAQQGIGAAMATAFAAAGSDVAINWLDDEAAAERVADRVRAAGRRAATLRADLGKIEEARGLVAQAEAALGPLDVLVNNAGIFPRVDFLDMDEAVWDAVQAVNLKGSVFCAQAAARSMVKGGRPGAIVNLTSGAAYRGSPRGVHYCASKGGVVSMTRQMALELAPHRIRVNAIAPGLTDTAQPRYAMSEDELAAGGRLLPLGRVARPDEIAKTAVFLASEEAGFITGQVVHVNGGGYLG